MIAEQWGDDAATTLSRILECYLSAEETRTKLWCENRDLRERLKKYEPPAPPRPIDPGPTWTGD
jgi:hypothetical protein